jgi:hypothetical protein
MSGEIKEILMIEKALEILNVGAPSQFNNAPTSIDQSSRISPHGFCDKHPHIGL